MDPRNKARNAITGRIIISEHANWWRPIATRLARSRLFFPAIAALLLAGIWMSAITTMLVARDGARESARATVHTRLEAYENQAQRALSEIDRALRLVQYTFETSGATVLPELKTRALLPAGNAFDLNVTDPKGEMLFVLRDTFDGRRADPECLAAHRHGDTFCVSKPTRVVGSNWKLRFSRRLTGSDGHFGGVVSLVVDAGYLVTDDDAAYGTQGLIALVGLDGIVRARRTDATIDAGDRVDYVALAVDVMPAAASASAAAPVWTAPWDHEPRYTLMRALPDMPLSAMTGLSVAEHTAAWRSDLWGTLAWATFASLLAIGTITLLQRLSRQLAQARLQQPDPPETQIMLRQDDARAARAEHLAYHDALTALPNRTLFDRLLMQSVATARRYGRTLSVMVIDLDSFKQVNDRRSREVGDQALRELTSRLRRCLHESDTLARLGGDEFVVLLPELGHRERAGAVAQKILLAIGEPMRLSGREERITACVGISLFPDDGTEAPHLIRCANLALQRAKDRGRNKARFFRRAEGTLAPERRALEAGLRQALARDQLELHYQAKRKAADGRISGMEALLRWRHPEWGLVAPMTFLPIAEELGLTVMIGRWVQRTAFEQIAQWERDRLGRFNIAINLTSGQLRDRGLVDDVMNALADTGLEAERVEIEVTESTVMRNVSASVDALTRLRALGVRTTIDDFGAGALAPASLHQFPLDCVKIDRSLIKDLSSKPRKTGPTDAIIAAGRTLKLEVVAEGVETKEQVEYLFRHDCDGLQGYFFSAPEPAEQVAYGLRHRQRLVRPAA